MAALIVFLAAACFVSPADGQGIEWSVSPGFGGLRRIGDWSYAIVQLENPGQPHKGEIVLHCPGVVEAKYRLPFELSSGETERHFLYFKSQLNACEAWLETDGKRQGEAKPVTLLSVGGGGIIVEVGTSTQVARAVTSDFRDIPPFARSDWLTLPSDPAGYDAVDWLFVSDLEKSEELPPGQASALKSWVETGGKLMVFVGREERFPEGPIGQLMANAGFKLQGRTEVKTFKNLIPKLPLRDELPPLSIGNVTAPQGTVRWSEEGQVVSAVARLGWGQIGVCALHPGRTGGLPVAHADFWDFLAGVTIQQSTYLLGDSEIALELGKPGRFVEVFGDLLLPGDPAFPVSMVWVLIYLLAYFSVLGPLQGWMLKKGKPFSASLAVFLAAIVVFVALANALVHWKKGKDIWRRDIGIINLSERGAARGMMFSAFFVPASEDLSLRAGPDVLAAPMMGGEGKAFGTRASLRHWDSWLKPSHFEALMDFRQWDTRVCTSSSWHYPSGLEGISRLPRSLDPILQKAYLIERGGVYSLGRVDLREELKMSKRTPKESFDEFAATGRNVGARKRELSADEIESILLALCVGQPSSVVDVDVREQLAEGRAVLVGFSRDGSLEPKTDPAPAHGTTVCLVRQAISRPVKR